MDYYVAPSGNDTNAGTSPEAAWRTVAAVNACRLSAGDRVLLEGGQTFAGPLLLASTHSGASGEPVEIAAYGEGRATLDGAKGMALFAEGCDHLRIRGLAFTGAGRKGGSSTSGVHLSRCRSVEVDDLDISGFQKAGLFIGGCEGVRVTRVRAHDNGTAGIESGGPAWSKGLYIGDCVAENNPGDPTNLTNHSGNGIVVGAARNVVIERCEAMRNGWDMPRTGNGPVGIWAYDADNVVIQHCLSHHNQSPGADGGGFDFDGGVTNSIMQYNFSHDNEGAGYGLFQYPGAAPWRNNVVRYNISQNDGLRNTRSGIAVWSAGPGMSDCDIYHNTVYNDLDDGHGVTFMDGEWSGMRFRNNIFVSRGAAIDGGSRRGLFQGNLYWGTSDRGFSVDGFADFAAWVAATGQERMGDEVVGRYADPRLAGAGAGEVDDPAKLASMAAYRIGADSPALDTGLNLRERFGLEPGSRDFFGNPIPRGVGYDVGAHESGEPDPPEVPANQRVGLIALAAILGWSGAALTTRHG